MFSLRRRPRRSGLMSVALAIAIAISIALAARPVVSAQPTNTWATQASMPTARFGLAAATGPDGKTYAIGGQASGFTRPLVVSTVQAYTSRMNSWSTVASMPTARQNLAAIMGRNGLIYAIGGATSFLAGSETNAVEAYNPSSNTWTTVASMPTARSGLAAAAGPDGIIYAIGGTDAFGNVLGKVETYDPIQNYWSTATSMPTARSSLAAVLGSNGAIYAIGGVNSSGVDVATVEAYVPVSVSWTAAPSLPTAREGLAAATGFDGRVDAIGGPMAVT